ncbi:hypothetical protein AAHA92_19078 [Salvia divinorum]|uniref:Uncharacterized protein n=1 Tax=Salvia divinorum TaxID=28513 RepID=A0ABD1H6Z3_SALDI
MEDRNILAADCIVLCCCCQCMMLQILIFILLKLPHKLMRKTKKYAKKLRVRKRGTKIMQIEMPRNGEDSFRSHGGSLRIESIRFGCCMAEIEHVLDDLSSRGEFAFGSFWGGEVASDTSFPSCFNNDQIDYEVVGCRLMELFGTANFSSQH